VANYPNVQLPSGCEEVTEDPSIRSEFEDGIVQTRAKFTRLRRTWALSWEYMWGADYRILRSFYEQMRGGALAFIWTHPTEGVSFEVRFRDTIRASNQSYDYWNVSLTLEQV
jgi:phage-related protein